jgi:hypothetical protein
VLEGAYHADETCRAFAVRVAVEHAQFEAWSKESGLKEAAAAEAETEALASTAATGDSNSLRFGTFLKYSGPVIVPVLSEILVLMTQLTSSEGKYAKLVDFDASNAAPDSIKNETDSAPEITDLMEPAAEAGSPVLPSFGQLLYRRNEIHSQTPHLLTTGVSKRVGFNTRTKEDPRNSKAFTDIASRWTRAARTAFEPRRLRWVIRDAEKCETRLRRLSELNSFLWKCLDRTDKTDLFRMVLLQMNTSKDLVQQLRVLMGALAAPHAIADTQSRTGETTLAAASLAGANTSSGGTRFITQAGSFVIDALETLSRPSTLPKVATMFSGEKVDLAIRTPATMPDGREVWIEWKTYRTTLDADGFLDIDPRTLDRMERLVTVLQIPTKPKEFCVPPCLGYFIDRKEARIGMIFQAPAHASLQSPRSLRELFHDPIAPLCTRMRISKALAMWLLHLHSVRWLHKGIRSDSVLFFNHPESLELGDPYITGFEYARTTGATGGTTKPPIGVDSRDFYVHPDYLNDQRAGGYQPVFDIYSLGIVFIELAYWHPIEEILRESTAESGAQTASKPGATRRQLLGRENDVLRGVESRMGRKYAAAVESCLSGLERPRDELSDDTLEERDAESNTTLLYDFNDGVIDMIDRIVI